MACSVDSDPIPPFLPGLPETTTSNTSLETSSTTTTTPEPTTLEPTTTTPDPTTTMPAAITPEPNTPEWIVSFVAAVQMSASEFDSAWADYIAGVAVALGRDESAVEIVSVVEVVTRRRLLDVSVLVETAVTVAADEAESVARSVTAESLNSVLAVRGIRVAEVTNVTVSAVRGAPEHTTTMPAATMPEPTTPGLTTRTISAASTQLPVRLKEPRPLKNIHVPLMSNSAGSVTRRYLNWTRLAPGSSVFY